MTNGPRADQAGIESLFDLGEPVADWADADLAAMLRHQLAQPAGPGQPSIAQVLEQRDASIESLQSVKRLAKVRRAQRDAAVPEDLWRVIYFASIAAAIRSGHSISDLSPAELSQGFQWALARPWVDDATVRRLIDDAMRLMAK